MGEGLKLRKRQVEKSKEKLQSLELVVVPDQIKNEIKANTFDHESTKLLHEFVAATNCTAQIQALKKCAASFQKAFGSPDAALFTPSAIFLVKILFCSPNPTINSIVVSFLNSIYSISSSSSSGATPISEISKSVAQEASSLIRALDAKEESHAFTVFQLATLSSLMEIHLAREIVDQNASSLLSHLSTLLHRHATFFATAGTQSLQDIAGECDIALRVLLFLLTKSQSAVSSVVLSWAKGGDSIFFKKWIKEEEKQLTGEDTPIASLFSAFVNLMSQPATPRSCFTHIGVAFAQVLYLCGDSGLIQAEFENIMKYVIESNQTTFPASILDRAFPSSSFLSTFSSLPVMSKLAILRGTAFIKAPRSNDVLFGKIEDSQKGKSILTDDVFPHVVELTLRGGEQQSQILGLQAAQGILQRLSTAIKEAPETSVADEKEVATPDKGYLVYKASQIAPTALHLAWTTWDSTVPSIPYHANLVFESLLDLVDVCGENTNNSDSGLTLSTIAARLLDVEWHQKGKYAPLLAVLERKGAAQILAIRGNFIPEMLSAISDHGVCNAIKQLLEQFLISIRNQTFNGKDYEGKTTEDKLEHCYSFWLNSVVSLLVGSSDLVAEYLFVSLQHRLDLF